MAGGRMSDRWDFVNVTHVRLMFVLIKCHLFIVAMSFQTWSPRTHTQSGMSCSWMILFFASFTTYNQDFMLVTIYFATWAYLMEGKWLGLIVDKSLWFSTIVNNFYYWFIFITSSHSELIDCAIRFAHCLTVYFAWSLVGIMVDIGFSSLNLAV